MHEVLPHCVRRRDQKGLNAQVLETWTVAIDDHAQVDAIAFDASDQPQLAGCARAGRATDNRQDYLDATRDFFDRGRIEREDRDARLRDHEPDRPKRVTFSADDAAQRPLQARPVRIGDALCRRCSRRKHGVRWREPVFAVLICDASPVFHRRLLRSVYAIRPVLFKHSRR